MSTTTTKTERINVTQFCEREQITLTKCERTNENPNMDSETPMDHWVCTLAHKSERNHSLTFPMGIGLKGRRPRADEIVSCLASDYAMPDTFEDFCAEYGYDEDSRKAERTFNACLKQREQLEEWLGVELCKELAYEVEGL